MLINLFKTTQLINIVWYWMPKEHSCWGKSIIYIHMFVLYTYIFDYSVSLLYLHPHPSSYPLPYLYSTVYIRIRILYSSSRTTYLFWFWFLATVYPHPHRLSCMYISSTSFRILLTFPQTPVFVLKSPLSSYHVTPRIYSTLLFSLRLHFYPCILPCSRHYPHFPPPFPCQYPRFTPYSSSLSSHVTPPRLYY